MCLLIYKQAGSTIPVEHLQEGMESNSDGAGFAIQLPDHSSVYIHKGIWSVGEFLSTYQKALDYYGGNPACMIHFRWSTGGKVNHVNCHPFSIHHKTLQVKKGYTDLALGHNGILSQINACKDYSDTYHLAEQLANKWTVKAIKNTLKMHCSASNKFVLLSPSKAHIIGEEHGHWDKGIWYSNGSYLPACYPMWKYRTTIQGDDMDLLEESYQGIFKRDLESNCLYCDKPDARYRLGDSECMVCWECKKDLTSLRGTPYHVQCSTCDKVVEEDVPHYCPNK